MRSIAVIVVLCATFTSFGADEKELALRLESVRTRIEAIKEPKIVIYRVGAEELADKDLSTKKNIQAYPILAEVLLDAKTGKEALALLLKPETYGKRGANCFEPGIAVKISGGPDEIDVVICLGCMWSYWWMGKDYLQLPISGESIAEFKKLFMRHFPKATKP